MRGRRLRQTGQHGHLGELQLVELLVVIQDRRSRDAVGPVAEEDLVEIELDNLLFLKPVVDGPRTASAR